MGRVGGRGEGWREEGWKEGVGSGGEGGMEWWGLMRR